MGGAHFGSESEYLEGVSILLVKLLQQLREGSNVCVCVCVSLSLSLSLSVCVWSVLTAYTSSIVTGCSVGFPLSERSCRKGVFLSAASSLGMMGTFSLGRKYRQRSMFLTTTQQLKVRGEEGKDFPTSPATGCSPDMCRGFLNPHFTKQEHCSRLVEGVLVSI